MPLYVNPDNRTSPPAVKTFYVDESSCEIGGVSHTLVGAICFDDDSYALSATFAAKKELSLRPEQEFKWNSNTFSAEQRHKITERILPILSRTTGLLIVSSKGKQSAIMSLAKQMSEFCQSEHFGGFICRFDKNLVANPKEFDSYAYSLDPPCAGWSEVDSAHDQLIQCADLFVGFQKLRIDFGLGRKDPKVLVEVEAYEGIREEYPLEWYLRLALRYSLWGIVNDDKERPGRPWKYSLGYGVRVDSCVPKEIMATALSHLEKDYLGCVH